MCDRRLSSKDNALLAYKSREKEKSTKVNVTGLTRKRERPQMSRKIEKR